MSDDDERATDDTTERDTLDAMREAIGGANGVFIFGSSIMAERDDLAVDWAPFKRVADAGREATSGLAQVAPGALIAAPAVKCMVFPSAVFGRSLWRGSPAFAKLFSDLWAEPFERKAHEESAAERKATEDQRAARERRLQELRDSIEDNLEKLGPLPHGM